LVHAHAIGVDADAVELSEPSVLLLQRERELFDGSVRTPSFTHPLMRVPAA
jgi:hypothetical protein